MKCVLFKNYLFNVIQSEKYEYCDNEIYIANPNYMYCYIQKIYLNLLIKFLERKVNLISYSIYYNNQLIVTNDPQLENRFIHIESIKSKNYEYIQCFKDIHYPKNDNDFFLLKIINIYDFGPTCVELLYFFFKLYFFRTNWIENDRYIIFTKKRDVGNTQNDTQFRFKNLKIIYNIQTEEILTFVVAEDLAHYYGKNVFLSEKYKFKIQIF